MNKSNRRSTPRSRVEQIKALRSSYKKLRPTTAKYKKSRGLAITSKLNNILNTSDNKSLNSTLVINKPSIPLIPISKVSTFVSPRKTSTLNLTEGSQNSNKTLNTSSILNSSYHYKRTPKPPSREKPKQQIRNQNFFTPQQQFEKLELPISGHTALQLFRNQVTAYERQELDGYKQVYYLGFKTAKVQAGDGPNQGFDDSKDNYRLFKHEHLAFRYQIIKMLGKGSFGQVCECFDHKVKQPVAIKIIKNHKRFHHQAGIQIKVLRHLLKQDPHGASNTVRMKECFVFRKHICIGFELLSSNLYDLLKNNGFKGFSLGLIRRLAIQILVGLRFINQLGVIHCDLKPENILLKQPNKSGIKIIDFGSACFNQEKVYTYIQSRFYRAPEIMLGIPYSTAIDMWSFGCILAELYTGHPLMAGQSESQQLELIMSLRGLPTKELLKKSTRKKLFFDRNTPKVKIHFSSVQEKIGVKEQSFLDLIQSCLELNPQLRITPDQALKHPWILEGLQSTETSKRNQQQFLFTLINGVYFFVQKIQKNREVKVNNFLENYIAN